VRPAQEDGAGAVQALHLRGAGETRARHHHQERQEDGRARGSGRLGHPGGRGPRVPHYAQPRADPAPSGHPGLRTAARGRQGHPAAPARVLRLQRGLRRRPDGRAYSPVGRGAD